MTTRDLLSPGRRPTNDDATSAPGPSAAPAPWGDDPVPAVTAQIAELVTTATGLRAQMGPEARSFSARRSEEKAQGKPENRLAPSGDLARAPLTVEGAMVDGDVFRVEVELMRVSAAASLPLGELFSRLPGVLGQWRVCEPRVAPPEGVASLWVSLDVIPRPLNATRRHAFNVSLTSLLGAAEKLRLEIPQPLGDGRLERVYAPFEEHLALIRPLRDDDIAQPDVLAWGDAAAGFLLAGYSIALAAPTDADGAFALGVVSTLLVRHGKSLGRVRAPGLPPRAVVEMATKAPGLLAVPAARLSIGSNRYEMGDDVQGMLRVLAEAGTPGVFTGSLSELRQVFGGGQGGKVDPMWPVVRHAPAVALGRLIGFSVRNAAAGKGGIAGTRETAVVQAVTETLADLSDGDARALLAPVVQRALVADGAVATAADLRVLVSETRAATEVLGGVGRSARVVRGARVQNNFKRILAGGGLREALGARLFGQDRALDELGRHLVTEVMTRPGHQPLRYLAQGTPGTGKSESTQLLAEALDVAHVNINCPSFPDWYTASAQLLGSGRGIVASHKAGRLEEIARGERGAVVEVSDLDHAPPGIRSQLADLFLNVLDTGEAESSSGVSFSCANLIFAFTLNLPGGLDEKLRRGRTGFGNAPTRDEIARDVRTELKSMMSGAFLSRVGNPILFDPLSPADIARIAARAVKAAAARLLEVAELKQVDVTVTAEAGVCVVAGLNTDAWTTGARTLLDVARDLTAHALLPLLDGGALRNATRLDVQAGAGGGLAIEVRTEGGD